MRRWRSTMTALALVAVVGAPAAAFAQAPKYGGVLNVMQREELPQGFSIHETSTIATVWPASPCFNNLVYFDPMKPAETADTIVGELAERWSWQDGYRNLVFFLRKGVKWHDGQPLTSRDVKFTFDMVREAPDTQAKLRLNPRKDWYANIEAIEAADPSTVVFRLKRPQPSILMMLASGQSPVYPAHVPLAEQRNRCVGTGPFKFKEWRRGEFVEYVKNPDYFVKGRPYLDGLKYVIISERGTRTAALQAGRLDTAGPGETTKNIADQLKAAVPEMVITRVGSLTSPNLLVNHARPPFNDARVRRAVDLAIDRDGYIKGVLQGAAVPGAALAPRPFGSWGLGEAELVQILGKPEGRKAAARKLLAEAGYGPAQSPALRDADARHRDLRRPGLVRGERAEAGRRRDHREAARQRAVVRRSRRGRSSSSASISRATAWTIPTPSSSRTTPARRAGTTRATATRAWASSSSSSRRSSIRRSGWPSCDQIQREAHGGGRAADRRLGHRPLRAVAAREEPVPHNSLYSFGRMQEVWLDR